ncbi:hypothetical protein GCM10029964_062020 [Kibdelosporangium lantanae]
MIGDLRTEKVFAGLPEEFDDALRDRRAAGSARLVDAVVANRRTVYLFVDGSCHVVSRHLTASYDLDVIGRVRNTIATTGKVDAALVAAGRTFLFSGDQYVRYSEGQYQGDYKYVDDGYPRTIASSLPAELDMAELPEQFHTGIDAAFASPDGRVPLPWPELPALGRVATGGASDRRYLGSGVERVRRRLARRRRVRRAGGRTVRFQGRAVRPLRRRAVDAGGQRFPTDGQGRLGDLPPSYEEGVDGAFVLDGNTYLVKGDEYVRYSGSRYEVVDRMYPQAFRQRWAGWSDYRLDDVATIARYMGLARGTPGSPTS